MLEKLYRSPLGIIFSAVASLYARILSPFMLYGFFDKPTGKFRKYTRISNTVSVINKPAISMGDHVWVWHYTILDGTEGLTIGEGCQIGAWVGIFTHGSEISIRLLGTQFVHVPNVERFGYTRGKVSVGEYSFIGAGSVVLPGITIGKGCLIGAGTLVVQDIPDYSIVAGVPGKMKGSTLDLDKKFFEKNDFSDTYYSKEALNFIKKGNFENE